MRHHHGAYLLWETTQTDDVDHLCVEILERNCANDQVPILAEECRL